MTDYILSTIFLTIGLGKLIVAVYFTMLSKKGTNGLRVVMIKCNSAGAILFMGLALIVLFNMSEEFSRIVSSLLSIPFAIFEYQFIRYLFKSLQ